jgi:hypothetical protein
MAMACPSTNPDGATVAAGVWGAQGIRLEVASSGGAVEYDCAHGEIKEPLKLDSEGRFTAQGTHTLERVGPQQDGEEPPVEPARYEGRVRGDTMTLTVVLTESGERLGPFRLERGKRGRLMKCL